MTRDEKVREDAIWRRQRIKRERNEIKWLIRVAHEKAIAQEAFLKRFRTFARVTAEPDPCRCACCGQDLWQRPTDPRCPHKIGQRPLRKIDLPIFTEGELTSAAVFLNPAVDLPSTYVAESAPATMPPRRTRTSERTITRRAA